jgi:CRP-like cAMP-binding protein
MVEIRDVINKVAILSEESREAFCSIFKESKIKKGEDFIRKGEMGEGLCFLRSGLMRSYYISPKGEEYNKHFFMPGTFCAPLTSLITKEQSPVYIGALKDTDILLAKYSDLEKVYKEHLETNILGRKLTEFAWIQKEKRETQLIMLSASERYEIFLQEYPGLDQLIPQYQIASYLGITPVQLSRIRAKGRF